MATGDHARAVSDFDALLALFESEVEFSRARRDPEHGKLLAEAAAAHRQRAAFCRSLWDYGRAWADLARADELEREAARLRREVEPTER